MVSESRPSTILDGLVLVVVLLVALPAVWSALAVASVFCRSRFVPRRDLCVRRVPSVVTYPVLTRVPVVCCCQACGWSSSN